MIIITQQRPKCIGCNYCVEAAPEYWRMSKKAGKCTLLHSVDKKGFHTVKINDEEAYEQNMRAAELCPVKIISVKRV